MIDGDVIMHVDVGVLVMLLVEVGGSGSIRYACRYRAQGAPRPPTEF